MMRRPIPFTVVQALPHPLRAFGQRPRGAPSPGGPVAESKARSRSWQQVLAFGLWACMTASLGVSVPASAQSIWFDIDFQPRFRSKPAQTYQPRPERQFQAASRRVATPQQVKTNRPTPPAAARLETAIAAAQSPSGVGETTTNAGETKLRSAIVPKTGQNNEPTAVGAAGAPLFAVVSIEDQQLSVYGAGGLIERTPTSTGTEDNPTPTGVFGIIQKERWHESNIYSGAAMPFMQRLTWSGIAMHTGELPGYPASHGCIRLPNAFAERWFGMTKLGLRVIIAPFGVEPTPIAHANLPVPRYWPGPQLSAKRQPVQAAALTDDTLMALASPDDTKLNPISYAAIEKAKAKDDLKNAERQGSAASAAADVAARALKDVAAKLKAAEREAQAVQERAAWFGLVGHRQPPPVRANFGDGILVARANFEISNSKVADARRIESAARDAADAAVMALKTADNRTEWLKARVTQMGRRQETASIFISRKDQRLYVRQSLRPLFDVPVVIRNPTENIGTHVIVAAPLATGENALRWTAVSLPVEVPSATQIARMKKTGEIETGSIGYAIRSETAGGALDRVQMPGEVLDKLAEFVWAGASVIISDHGINAGNGPGHDFAVETRH